MIADKKDPIKSPPLPLLEREISFWTTYWSESI